MIKTPLQERVERWLFAAPLMLYQPKHILLHHSDKAEAEKLYPSGQVLFDGTLYPIKYLGTVDINREVINEEV